MRVYNQGIPGIHKAYEQQKKQTGIETKGIRKKYDDLKLSSEAKLWGTAAKALRELPEPVKDLSELQKAVSSGTYQVSCEEVAEKIWQESIFDQKV